MLTLALPASTADYYHLRDYVTNTYGSALSGVYVYVYDAGTTTPATAYSDIDGNNSVTFPLETDSNGMFDCYIVEGNYDIAIVHSGHAIDATWDDYMVPMPPSASATCVDTLKSCSNDTLYVRASDGARHGVLKVNQLVLEDALGHGSDRAAIRFGTSESGTVNPRARVYLPYYGVFWMTRAGYYNRVPDYDWNGGVPVYNGHQMLGIGGTTGRAFNWQFWEDTQITFARARGDSAAGDTEGLRYRERSVISFGRKLTAPDGSAPPDAAYATADTLRCDAYQSLDIRNDWSDRLRWMHMPRGHAPDTLHGVIGGPYGTPDYGIRLQTDLPDSNGSEGSRDAVQIRWWMTPSGGEIRYPGSSFLTMLEHNTENYVFARDYLELRPSKEGSVNKGIRFIGSGGDATRLKLDDSEGAFLMYVTDRDLYIYDADGTPDDARLRVSQVRCDTLKARVDSTLYVRADDMKDNATLDVNRVACDTLKPRTGATACIRAADGQNDATLEVDNLTLSGDLAGARVWTTLANNASNQAADLWLYAGVLGNSTLRGCPATVGGSVRAYAVRYNVDSYNAGAYAVTRFYINGAKAFADSFYIDATGWHDNQDAFTRGTHTFSAGDHFSVEFDVEGTLQFDVPIATLDLQLDD